MKVMIEVQQNSGQKVFDLILEVIGKQLNQDQMMHIIFSGKIFIHFGFYGSGRNFYSGRK